MGFEVEQEAQGQVLSYLVFSFQILFCKSSRFIHLSSGTGKWSRLEAVVPPRCILTDLSYKRAMGTQFQFLCRMCFRHLLSAVQYLGVGQTDYHYIPCTGYTSRLLRTVVNRPQSSEHRTLRYLGWLV